MKLHIKAAVAQHSLSVVSRIVVFSRIFETAAIRFMYQKSGDALRSG